MTADEQEALSRHFGPWAIKVLPLKSGNWALFDNAHNLLGIVTFDNLAAEIFEHSHLLAAAPTPRAFTAPKLSLNTNPIDLEDLGL